MAEYGVPREEIFVITKIYPNQFSDPEAAIDKVTTPGGITIKGLNELDHAAFNSAVIRCLKAGLQ